MVKQFKDAKEGHFFACTPRATIHAHHGDGSNVTSRHHHDDGLQSFIHAYPVKDGHGIKVEIPPEDGTGCGMVWNLKRSLCGLGEADLRFHEFCALSWWNLVFEVWNAERTIFFHRQKKNIRVVGAHGRPACLRLLQGGTHRILRRSGQASCDQDAVLGSVLQRSGRDRRTQQACPYAQLSGRCGDGTVQTSRDVGTTPPRGATQRKRTLTVPTSLVQYAVTRGPAWMYPLKDACPLLSNLRNTDMEHLKHFAELHSRYRGHGHGASILSGFGAHPWEH